MKQPNASAYTRASDVHPSTGNVFADLGLNDPAARLAKAQLAHGICRAIELLGLTQKKAAELMGLDQPKISALMRGKLKGFSTERLFRCLNDLGREVKITVGPTRKGFRCRGTTVVAVPG